MAGFTNAAKMAKDFQELLASLQRKPKYPPREVAPPPRPISK
ncbi:MAG TPA: hypothetical protein VGL71_10595 [Urbifossiella sp.]|jgi:hypothetical protein